MDVWELDILDDDDWVGYLEFPDCSVVFQCDYSDCYAVSSWKNPTDWDKYHRIDAKIRLKVEGFLIAN